MSVLQLLDVLRDARDEGLWKEQALIVAELDIDSAYVRRRCSHSKAAKWCDCVVIVINDPYGDQTPRQRAAGFKRQAQRAVGSSMQVIPEPSLTSHPITFTFGARETPEQRRARHAAIVQMLRRMR